MAKITNEQALAIKDRHSMALLKTPGVHGVAVREDGAGNQTLLVLADASLEQARLPAQIEGLPVALERTEPFRPLRSENR